MAHRGHNHHHHHAQPAARTPSPPSTTFLTSSYAPTHGHHPMTDTSTAHFHHTTTTFNPHLQHLAHGHHHGHGLGTHQPLDVNDLGTVTPLNDLTMNHVDQMDQMDHMDHSSIEHDNKGHTLPVFKWIQEVNVLFEPWTTSTILHLVLAMVAAALLAAIYDWLRNYLSSWDNSHITLNHLPTWRRLCLRFYRSFMHALTAATGYIQMLFAMTYDLRIFVAIILGSGLGFFILGPYFRRLKSERWGKSCREIVSLQQQTLVVEGQEVHKLLEVQVERDVVDGQLHSRESTIILDETALRQLNGMRDTVV